MAGQTWQSTIPSRLASSLSSCCGFQTEFARMMDNECIRPLLGHRKVRPWLREGLIPTSRTTLSAQRFHFSMVCALSNGWRKHDILKISMRAPSTLHCRGLRVRRLAVTSNYGLLWADADGFIGRSSREHEDVSCLSPQLSP